MRPKTSLAAALVALGGAGVASNDDDGRSGVLSFPPSYTTAGGVIVTKTIGGGFEIQLS